MTFLSSAPHLPPSNFPSKILFFLHWLLTPTSM
jgi:hypothetical protein